MAKFNHRAKWERREESRKARESASHVCMGDPFLDMASEFRARHAAASEKP